MQEEVQSLLNKLDKLKKEIQQVITGQTAVIDQLLVTLMAGGHALLEGVPGLGKTLMVRTIAEATSLNFNRIQFTPDLMPADIIGTEILQENKATGERSFYFNKGPVFANIVLADEINRTPPKTQAALLEAMQEKAISYAGQTYPLPLPFFILATQNPIEQAGTFPLPEAQLDRFMLFIKIAYPNESEEKLILKNTTGNKHYQPQTSINGAEIVELQKLVRDVHLNDDLLDWINKIVRATRPASSNISFVSSNVQWGAGPRAGQSVILAAKAYALLNQRFAATEEDVRTVVFPALRHRILLNFKAEAEGHTTDDVIKTLLEKIGIEGTTL